MNYKQKYHRQHHDARVRGIDWQFTYETWLDWWGDDIVNRGNKSGQLVMARNGDTGPYHPSNVRKITCNENHSEAHTNGLGWGRGSKHSPEALAKMLEASKKPRKKRMVNPPWSAERRAAFEAKKAFDPTS